MSLRLLEGARRRLELARECIERGEDPQRRLRSAMLRITRLPATLAPADEASIANLADLSAYMCRELSAAGGTADLGALGRICELLREIRCAWVTLPPRSIHSVRCFAPGGEDVAARAGAGDSYVRRLRHRRPL